MVAQPTKAYTWTPESTDALHRSHVHRSHVHRSHLHRSHLHRSHLHRSHLHRSHLQIRPCVAHIARLLYRPSYAPARADRSALPPLERRCTRRRAFARAPPPPPMAHRRTFRFRRGSSEDRRRPHRLRPQLGRRCPSLCATCAAPRPAMTVCAVSARAPDPAWLAGPTWPIPLGRSHTADSKRPAMRLLSRSIHSSAVAARRRAAVRVGCGAPPPPSPTHARTHAHTHSLPLGLYVLRL